MNYSHTDSTERVHTLPLMSPLPDIIPPSFFGGWVEMTGEEERGKEVMERGDGEIEMGGRGKGKAER